MKKIVYILAAFFIASSLYADNRDASAEAVRKASEAFNVAYETNDVEGYFNFYEENAMTYFYGERWTVSDYYDPSFDEKISLDLNKIEPSVAGPKDHKIRYLLKMFLKFLKQ